MTRADAARERWKALSPAERQARVRAMQAGRQKSRSPERLAAVEAEMDRLGEEFRSLPRGHARRLEILRELEPLGNKRYSLIGSW